MTADAAYEQALQTFHTRAVELLTAPVHTGPPPPTGPLYAGGPPLDLLIYLAEARADQVGRTRAQVPATTLLFWLHPPCPADQERPFQAALERAGRSVDCALTPDTHYIDRLVLLISVLPGQRVSLIASQTDRVRYAAELRDLNEAITSALETVDQDRTRGLIRLRCSIHNLPGIAANADLRPRRLPPGMAAIVCGAGPSLADQLDMLRAVATRAVLVAVGHAVPTLMRAGIVPHVVVEGDPQAWQNWPADLRPDSLLSASPEVSPEVAARFTHAVWCVGCSMPFNIAAHQWSLPLLNIRLNKTVTVPAIETAILLGCDRVALVGQDLSLAATGELHAGGDRLNTGDTLVQVPGNDGQPLEATQDLAGLREALQAYLRLLAHPTPGRPLPPPIHNCTAGGAVIEGTVRTALAEFCLSIPPDTVVPPLWERAGNPPPLAPHIDATLAALYAAQANLADTGDCLKRLRRELEAYPPNSERLRTQQARLQHLLHAGDQQDARPDLRLWLPPLAQYTDFILRETPGLIPTETQPEPLRQLALLQARTALVRGLIEDLRADFEGVRARLAAPTGSATLPPVAPHVFRAFRRHALQIIRTHNRDLARWLEESPDSLSDRFDIFWINQVLPMVRVRAPAGDWLALCRLVSIREQATEDVDRFVRESGYQPDRHGVVALAPGHWMHLVEFARRNPAARLIVIEPWPELLSALIDRGCFLHLLPPDTLIVGVHLRMDDWKKRVRFQLGEWKARGITPLLWPHPRAGTWPEVDTLKEVVMTDND